MTRFQSILVATDLSPSAHHPIRKAAALASLHGGALTLLHVMSPAGSPALRRLFMRPLDVELKRVQLRASLRRFAKDIVARHGIAVSFDVIVGDAYDEILRASQRADLVVLGRHAFGSVKARVMAGATDRLLRTCRTPLLVVKREADDRPYGRVLVPVDFTLYSEAALGMASCLCEQGAIHVFHAGARHRQFERQMAGAPEPAVRDLEAMEDGETRARMQAMARKAGLQLGRVHVGVGRGDPSGATLEQEKLLQPDVIVVGKQGRSTMADFLLGSVTRRLLAHTACDMLVMPRAAAEAWCPPTAKPPSRPSTWAAAARDGPQRRLVWK